MKKGLKGPRSMWMRHPGIWAAKVLKLSEKRAVLLTCVLLVTGCATAQIQPADPQLVLKSDLLGFLQDGVTTREEAVLKLGLPSAQIEGEKILMYQLKADENGKWHLTAPRWNADSGLRAWREGTCSLVLIFGESGVLRKHSLVMAQ